MRFTIYRFQIPTDVSTDPYLTEDYLPGNQEAIASYTGFSPQDLKKIRHENALALFPRIRAKLESDKKQ